MYVCEELLCFPDLKAGHADHLLTCIISMKIFDSWRFLQKNFTENIFNEHF